MTSISDINSALRMTASAANCPMSDCHSLGSIEFVMGSPFMKLVGVETASVVMWVARHFSTHRHQFQRAGFLGVYLPDTVAARGKTLGRWCAGVVGGVVCVHVKILRDVASQCLATEMRSIAWQSNEAF